MTSAGTADLPGQLAAHQAGHCARHPTATGIVRTVPDDRNANGSPATKAARDGAANAASGTPPRQPSKQDRQP